MKTFLWKRRVGVLILCLLLSLPAVNPAAYAATPATLTVTEGAEEVTVSNYDSGATIEIYRFNGTLADSKTNVTGSSVVFDLLAAADGYYAIQRIGGAQSMGSSIFNPSLVAPTLAADGEDLVISGVPAPGKTFKESERTFKLYLNSPSTEVAATPVYDSAAKVYRYSGLEPNSRQYYAVQTNLGAVSGGSGTASPAARTPVAAGGVEYVDVTNTYSNAVVKLYQQNGTLVSITPTYNATDLKWTFAGVPAGTYYVEQTINGIVAAGSNLTNVTADLPAAPSLTVGVESLDVSGILPNAALKLYTSKGVFVDSYSPTGTTYTISNLVPNPDSYYVTQTVNSKESLNSNIVNPTLRVPTATDGEGYIDVTNVTPGATLNLYNAKTSAKANLTAVDRGNGVYRFENVVPNIDQYYVTQSLGGSESVNTPYVNSSLPQLVLTGGTNYVDVSKVYPNAEIELYNSSGTQYIGSPQLQSDGSYRYADLPEDSGYYARQKINGVVSVVSASVKVGFPIPAAPTVESGLEKIVVSGYESGATLKLYLKDGTPVDTFAAVTGTTYTLENVVPNVVSYYVTQTVNGKESINSDFVNPKLRAPVLSGGTDYIDVSNIYPDANVTIQAYTSSGAQFVISPTGPVNGVYRYANVPEGTGYYATQTLNGVISEASNSVNVSKAIPNPPSAVGDYESVVVSGYEPGATLKLYVADGISLSPVATEASASGTTYTFSEVLPNPDYYYVTQTVNGKESSNSLYTNSKLRIPAVTPILGAIEVRGVSANTVLYLRNAVTGALVSDKSEDLGGGVYRFNVTEPLAGAYYVTQSAGTIESENSVFVNPILPKPTVTANGRTSIDVGNLYPGAAVKLYNSADGREVAIQAVAAENGVYRFNNVPAGRYFVDQLVNGIPSPHSDSVTVAGLEVIVNPGPIVTVPSPTPSTPNTANTPVDILVNGQIQKVGTLASTTENGQPVQTIRVNSEFVRNLLNQAPSGAIVTIPFATASADAKTVGELDDSLIRLMQSKNATLSLQTPLAEYRVPAASIRLASGEAQNGSNVRITVAPASPDETRSIDNALSARTSKRIASPVDFGIVSSSGGTTVETGRFPNYVERLLPIPASVDSDNTTVTAVVRDNGTVRHVPTRIVTQNSVRYASVKSFDGETFALVAGRSSFGDLAGSWAQSAVEDMASRLIVQGTGSGNFEPARSVNRAEFAAILAAGLGLSADNAAASGFADVSAGDWYSRDVAAAAQYGLINGFGDGTFRPDKTITRAEAMAMLARAMKVSGLGAVSADASTLGAFADQADVPQWAREAAAANVQAGLIEGTEQRRLVPGAQLSRAEAAALIRRLLAESGLI